MTFTLKDPPIIIVVIITVVVVSPPIFIIRLQSSSPITLVSRFYSAIGHYVCAFIKMFRSTSGVFSYSFELLISLECIIYCHNVKYDQSYNDSANKAWRFLYKRTSPMWIRLLLLSPLGFPFSFVISILLSVTHIFSCLSILCSVLIFFFAFTLSPIVFIFFVVFRFWMIGFVFVCVWINVSAVSLFAR